MNADAEQVFRRAERLFARGHYDQSRPLFERIVASHPEGYADVHNRLGMIHHIGGRVEEAANCYERAVTVNPGYTEASLNLVVALNDLGRYEEAEQVFFDAADHAGGDGESPALAAMANRHLAQGDEYVELGRLDDALHEYRRALTLRPTYVDVICKVGSVLRRLERLDDALRVLMRAKELNGRYAEPYVQCGLIYYRKGFLDNALAEWSQALEIDPSRRDAEAFLATVRRALLQQ
jgi:tetratricopeptide (TPR) repeat protein